MVDEGRYCIDILTQVKAIKAALKKVEDKLLNNLVAHCVEEAIYDAKAHREKFSRLFDLMGKYRS